MKNVFIIWEYDDGIVPEKSLVFVCDSMEIAQKEQRKLKQGMPKYIYEIESKELKTKRNYKVAKCNRYTAQS